jgi:hypothetical protein
MSTAFIKSLISYFMAVVFIIFRVFVFSDEERGMAKPIGIYFQSFLAYVPKMGRKTLLIKITLIQYVLHDWNLFAIRWRLVERLNLGRNHNFSFFYRAFFTLKLNSVSLVRERTIPTERPPPVGEVSANFCG